MYLLWWCQNITFLQIPYYCLCSVETTDVCTISISRRGNGRAASVKMEKDVGLTEEPRKWEWFFTLLFLHILWYLLEMTSKNGKEGGGRREIFWVLKLVRFEQGTKSNSWSLKTNFILLRTWMYVGTVFNCLQYFKLNRQQIVLIFSFFKPDYKSSYAHKEFLNKSFFCCNHQ